MITAPSHRDNKSILKAFNNVREKLHTLRSRSRINVLKFYDGFESEIAGVKIIIKSSNYGNQFSAHFKNDTLEIITPIHTDFDNDKINEYVKNIILKIVKRKAEIYLPQRIKILADAIKVKYNSCGVSYGKQRLGRCDNKGNILLSYRLMLMPRNLSDFIILHELTNLT